MSDDTKRDPLAELAAAEQPSEPESTLSLSRRRFLGGVGAAAGLTMAGVLPAFMTAVTAAGSEGGEGGSPEAPGAENPIEHIAEESKPVNYPGKPVYYADEPGDQKWAMVIDVKACVGCRKCVYACVRENNIGRNSGFTYIQVLEMEPGKIELETANANYEEGGRPDKWYLPVQCMHCAKPTCVYGCPVKATWREPDGIVVIDYDKCISCRNCMVTCPYFARHFNWVEPEVPKNEVNPKVPLHDKAGVVEKCTFCIQRTRNGKTTACTEACPVGARKFGDLNDPDSEVSVLLRTRRAFRLKEELGSEPMIWYVG
ncbi:MAG: 4Fe-4S dicluster domain-containing protein [Coriobacteriales bacterium]|nr:4Fe-4S dicluster domain-containing protein [Coriobacteriales bacterium]